MGLTITQFIFDTSLRLDWVGLLVAECVNHILIKFQLQLGLLLNCDLNNHLTPKTHLYIKQNLLEYLHNLQKLITWDVKIHLKSINLQKRINYKNTYLYKQLTMNSPLSFFCVKYTSYQFHNFITNICSVFGVYFLIQCHNFLTFQY